MNFSNKKMLRKILSLVTAMILMTTLFTGCLGKDENTEPSDPPISIPTSTPTVPETEPVPTETEEVNENMATVLNTLNVRKSPSDEAPSVGTLYAGDQVEVTKTMDALGVVWGRITEPMEGWICLEYVSMPNDTGTDTPDETEPSENTGNSDSNGSDTVVAKGTVTAGDLNIRKEPNTDSERLGGLKKGDRVEILEKKNGWGRIEKGWISLDHVKLDNSGSNENTNNGNNAKPDEGNGSTKVISRGVVYKTDYLNIRSGPDKDTERVGGLNGGARVEIYEKDGNWGRIDKGWISLSYVYIDGTGTGNNKYGTVTGDDLNIRSGPGTGYASVGSLDSGDEVTILFRVTVGKTTWGNIKQGWISMDYVDLDGDDDDDDDGITWEDDDDTDEGNGSTEVVDRGIVTANGLNIRKSADGDADKVGSLSYGARVEILEKDGNWGRISKGWISLNYVYIDGTGDGGDYGTVTDGLNIRSGPGDTYTIVGGLDEGDEVEILFELDVGDTTWGNIEDGWICMDYVDLD